MVDMWSRQNEDGHVLAGQHLKEACGAVRKSGLLEGKLEAVYMAEGRVGGEGMGRTSAGKAAGSREGGGWRAFGISRGVCVSVF